ncbi:MAG TPA: hypothetical protein VHZ56_09325, partial [Devosia sp.]|nr:hypothetical protein [Devosia sp.]
GHILGAGIVGAGAAELAALFAFAMDQRIEVARLAELAAPYPSHAELARILGEQALAGTGRARLAARRFALNRLLP